MLKFIITHDVNTQHIRLFSQISLGSLLARGWVERRLGNIVATQRGIDAYESYNRATVNYRKRESDVSDRVALMLNLRHDRKTA